MYRKNKTSYTWGPWRLDSPSGNEFPKAHFSLEVPNVSGWIQVDSAIAVFNNDSVVRSWDIKLSLMIRLATPSFFTFRTHAFAGNNHTSSCSVIWRVPQTSQIVVRAEYDNDPDPVFLEGFSVVNFHPDGYR